MWLLGVWDRSPEGKRIARELLRDWPADDVGASPYAVRSYNVNPDFGGEEELRTIRQALRARGLRLLLDFVPNHLARDHSWTTEHPERFVRGPDGFAYGRDPYFPPWTDTYQLDYRRADVREAMKNELLRISELCDGVRCDMAMLVLRDVFRRTWGGDFDPPDGEFWPGAIDAVRQRNGDFIFLAEAYWGLEGELRSMGFDFTYDKTLYDRLRNGDAAAVCQHLRVPRHEQDSLARFIENHDEDRAVRAFASPRAAATIALTLPGLRLIHDGQLEGRSIRIPIQLTRRPDEPPDPSMQKFYAQLLPALRDPVFSTGEWRLLEPKQAWDGNPTHDNFIAFTWTNDEQMRLVVVNLAPTASQCYLQLDAQRLSGGQRYLYDLINDIEYRRSGDELLERGLYLNVPPFFSHVFIVQDRPRADPVHAHAIAFLEERGVLRGGGSPLYGMAWSPDGETLAYGGSADIWLSNGKRLIGHTDAIGCLAWARNGHLLVSGSDDRTVRVWDVGPGTSRVLHQHDDHVVSIAWSPDGRVVASGGLRRGVSVGDLHDTKWWPVDDVVNALAWTRSSNLLACGLGTAAVEIRDRRDGAVVTELRPADWVGSLAWSPDDSMLAVGTGAGTVEIWDPLETKHVHICEGHTERILSLVFSPDGRLLVSKSADGSVRFWDTNTWQTYAAFEEAGIYLGGLAFSSKNILATRDDAENRIRLWRVDLDTLFRTAPMVPATYYKNAKVVLVGDSGVGKTALAIRLAQDRWEPATSSTAGTWATQLPLPTATASTEVESEIWLWDFAGQPDYRLVQQLYMDETSLALFVFNPQIENPFDGLAQWDRDVQRAVRGDIPKLLVAARIEVAELMASRERLDAFMRDRGFAEYVETSAKTNRGCNELRNAIIRCIPWDMIPSTVSPRIFRLLKEEIIKVREENRVLVRTGDLHRELELRLHENFTIEQLRAVIGLLSGPGLVWRLDFGDFVLLRPERINAYAAAVIRTVRAHPQEIGAIAEEKLLKGELDYQDMNRLPPDEEAIILRAMYETLVRRGICLREHAEGGTFLIFPTFYRRERPALASDLPAMVSYRFEGALDEIYSTLIVRLHYSAAFGAGTLWRFAADYRTPGRKRLGLKMIKHGEGAATIEIYAQPGSSDEVMATFIGYVHEHLARKAQNVERIRHYVCSHCRSPIADQGVVRRLLEKGRKDIVCQFCDQRVPLWDLVEELYASDALRQKLREIDERANAVRDNESKELTLVGNVYVIVATAGQIYRQYTNSDHGIDGEIEFKTDRGHASGKRLYLQLKSGDSYLRQRKKDGVEVFRIAKEHHAKYWQEQPCPVMLVIATTEGGIRWMDISEYLRRETAATRKLPTQVLFEGEPFTPEAVWNYRRRLFS